MKGQQALIALRMRGYKPTNVFVTVLDAEQRYSVYTHPDMSMSLGGFPEIDIEPTDKPATADFRFLAGLCVHINGLDAKRVKAFYDRILAFSPAEVIASANNSRGILHYRAEQLKEAA